jgi:hypothetical protein
LNDIKFQPNNNAASDIPKRGKNNSIPPCTSNNIAVDAKITLTITAVDL